MTFAQRLVIAGKDVWFYLGKLVWPHPLVFVYPRWHVSIAGVADWLPLVALMAAAVVVGRLGRRGSRGWRAAGFAGAYFVLLLFPVLGFFSVYYFRYSFVADHFQYLASMGPLALAGAGISTVTREAGIAGRSLTRKRAAWGLIAATVCLLVAFVAMDWRQCGIYRDPETLYAAIVRGNPRCWFAQNNLGALYFGRGDWAKAIPCYEAAESLEPNHPEMHNNLGMAYAALPGRLPDALRELQEAVRLRPDYPEALNGLGNVLLSLGRPAEAIPAYREALERRPDFFEAQSNLGAALAATPGRLEEAIVHYRVAVRLRPEFAPAHLSLAAALLGEPGREFEARRQLELALRLDPTLQPARDLLAQLPPGS